MFKSGEVRGNSEEVRGFEFERLRFLDYARNDVKI